MEYMSFLTEEQRSEFRNLLIQGYNYLAFNNGCASVFKTEETPFLALGCYRTKTGYTGEPIEINETLAIHCYVLINLQKLVDNNTLV